MTDNLLEFNKKIIEGMKKEILLLRQDNDHAFFERCLKSGYQFDKNTIYFNRKESLELILKHKRYDLLNCVSVRTLLKKKGNITYLEYILKLAHSGENINLSIFDPFLFCDSFKNIADVYILYLKYGFEKFLPSISEKQLSSKEKSFVSRIITNDKTLLDIMIERSSDPKKIIEKYVPNSYVKDINILMSLKKANMKDDSFTVKMPFDDRISNIVFDMEYDKYDSLYNMLCLSDKVLLEDLTKVCKKNSDEAAIKILIYSYIEQLYSGDRNAAIREIKELTSIFLKDEKLKLIIKQRSYYDPYNHILAIDTKSTNVMNHELGHLFFDKTANNLIENDFYNIIYRVRNNIFTKDKITNLTFTFQKYEKYLKKEAETYYDIYNKSNPIEEEDINEYLVSSKEELFAKYKNKSYSDDDLNVLLSKSFTKKEYNRQYRDVQLSAIRGALMKLKIYPILQIADIIDAIYEGEFLSGTLKDHFGNDIEPVTGHGIFYYKSSEDGIFNEILAEYISLRKNVCDNMIYYSYYYRDKTDTIRTKNIYNPIEALRIIVGNELVNYLENYYQKYILKAKIKTDDYLRRM